MKLILLSNPSTILNEHEIVNSLFEEGLNYFHLRKPQFSQMEMEDYIKRIDVSYRKNIVLHSYHDLCKKYNLKGVHYNERSPFIKEDDHNEGFHKSSSLHSLKEVEDCVKEFNYVFLSPIFNSISKEGYKGNFDLSELKKVVSLNKAKGNPKVIALGGIDEQHLEKAKEMGFDGVAVLGALWKEYADSNGGVRKGVITKFKNLQKECIKLDGVRQ